MIIDSLIKKILNEATSDSNGARGSYVVPLRPRLKEFDKSQLKPFDIPVSKYNNPQLAYDSYDGEMKTPKKQIKKLENKAKKNPNQKTNKLDEWILITDNVIDEGTSSVVSGEYTGPVELGLKKWKPQHLGPFKKFVDTEINHNKKQKTLKNNIKRIVGVWEKNADGSYDDYEHDVHTINEDLAVWFGKKKKPKGSSQPKGPWVDICRKVNGKHPPCGRSDADKGSYPKCRAAGVAGKMTDSEKKSACQQKRRAEKKDPQRGKGQKPVMVSHKKKTNENMEKNIITLTENDLYRIVKRVLKESEKNKNDYRQANKGKEPEAFRRQIKLSDGQEKIQEYTTIRYGYNNLNKKEVVATHENSPGRGPVNLNCEKKTVSYLADENSYNDINMEEQRKSDFNWLYPWCLQINWNSKVKEF
jgi:hypothetical protein